MTDTAAADGDDRKRTRRRSNLTVAPTEKRCKALIPEDDGTHARCSRYSILGEDGRRETYCIGHSQSRHAQDIREQRRRTQATQRRREAAARERLSRELLPPGISSPSDLQAARVRIGRAVVEGKLTPGQANALRGIVADLGRSPRS